MENCVGLTDCESIRAYRFIALNVSSVFVSSSLTQSQFGCLHFIYERIDTQFVVLNDLLIGHSIVIALSVFGKVCS